MKLVHSYRLLVWAVLSPLLFSSVFAQPRLPFARPAPHFVSSRQDVEAYAATNKAYAPAIEYVVDAMDGKEPETLPAGVTEEDIGQALQIAFPKAASLMHQPVSFYGRVVDESNQPVPAAQINFGLRDVLFGERRISTNMLSDETGSFTLTGWYGEQLNVRVSKPGYYTPGRNQSASEFQFAAEPGQVFKPDSANPLVYHLRKKGKGVDSLINSQLGMRDNVWAESAGDGTTVKVDLLNQKVADGPLEISQIKPHQKNWQLITSWFFSMKIADGGFVEENDEFAFYPPETGYQPVVAFNFQKGQTNWATGLRKDYYIKFGNPSLYGTLHVETSSSEDAVILKYVINPDGSRYLEPKPN
jgi:hypothetical protein